jgi:hypothetical protein
MAHGTTAHESAIVRFYRGEGLDHRGRTLREILGWDDERLEHVHDYIQWLFPLDEPSGPNPDAPLLTPDDRATFSRDAELRLALGESLRRMLAFFGFRLEERAGAPVVERAADFHERKRVWLRPHSHNHLRLTRILRSLCLLGLGGHARSFFACLTQMAGADRESIGGVPFRFWADAVKEASGRGPA